HDPIVHSLAGDMLREADCHSISGGSANAALGVAATVGASGLPEACCRPLCAVEVPHAAVDVAMSTANPIVAKRLFMVVPLRTGRLGLRSRCTRVYSEDATGRSRCS